MNYIDIIIIILLIFSVIGGLNKGFIYEFASLFALIAGVWGAIKFSGATRDILEHQFNFHNNSVQVIAFIITFVIIIILVHIIAKAIERAVETVNIGVVNRILGGIFSAFKTAFILGVLFIFIPRLDEAIPSFPDRAIEESRFYNPMRNVAVYSFPFLKGIYEDFKDTDHHDKQKQSEPDSTKNT
jgi:membrane protein required for colicin V production